MTYVLTRVPLLVFGVFLAASPASALSDMTNCPDPSASAQGTTTGAAPASSQEKSETGAKSVEKSAILPSAGQHEKSAAPTVQRDGKSTEVRADCPQDPNAPKPK